MASQPASLSGLLQRVVTQSLAGFSDRQLLERFATAGDEAAFAAILDRHGPLLFGVCRRMLADEHLAEDVLQATFLVLARKAGSIRRRESLASWLYGVAQRLARQARLAEAARSRREQRAGERRGVSPTCATDPAWDELLHMLDEELQRLPERYRAPLLLCYLEGQTQDEAAKQLGWSLSTLRRRLDHGRESLRTRMTRRGATLGAGLFAGFLATTPARATLTAELQRAVLATAFSGARGGAISVSILALANGGMRMAMATKLCWGAVLTAALGGMTAAVVAVGEPSYLPQIAQTLPPRKGAATAARADDKKDSDPKLDSYGDPLPPGALMRVGTIRFQHGKPIESAALSPDGRILVTAGADAIRVWDAATGRPLRHHELLSMPRGFGSGGSFLCISPDGTTLACAGEDPKVRFWNLATGAMMGELDVGDLGKVSPRSIAYSPDGKRLALSIRWIAGQTPDVSVWEVATGKKVLAFANTGSFVQFTRDGKGLIVKGDDEKSVAFVSAENGERLRQFVHGAGIMRVAFSTDGKWLATAGTDKTVRIWDVAAGKERHALVHPLPETSRPDNSWITAVTFSADNKLLASAGVDNIIRLWDVESGKELRTFRGHSHFVTCLLFAPDGTNLYSASWDNGVRKWDVATGNEIAVAPAATSHPQIVFSPDGKLIAGSQDGRIQLTETATGRQRAAIQVPNARHLRLEFTKDGSVLVSCGSDGVVRLWDVASGKLKRTFGDLPGDGKLESRGLALAHDVRTMAVSYGDVAFRDNAGKIRLWEVATGKMVHELDCPEVGPMAFAPDGRTLAVAGMRGKITLWDLASGQKRIELGDKPSAGLDALAFSPDSRTLASSHRDFRNIIKLWDVGTGRLIRGWRVPQQFVPSMMVGTPEIVWSLTFTPDGLELLAACLDGSMRVYDSESGKELLHRIGHKGWVTSVAASRDGRTAWTGSMDGTALQWDLRPSDPPLPEGPMLELWKSLAADGVVAHRATWALVAHPSEAVAMLQERLRPAPFPPQVDVKTVERLMSDLDSSEFAVREAASKALADFGAAIEPQLKKKLTENPTLEMRRRVEGLLGQLPTDRDTPETMRHRRAVCVLEQIGSADARLLLNKLSEGAPDARLTWAAKAALQRLDADK